MSLILNGGVGGSGSTQFGYYPGKIITQLPFAISFMMKSGVNSPFTTACLTDGTATLNSTPNYVLSHGIGRSLGPIVSQTIRSRMTTSAAYSTYANLVTEYSVTDIVAGSPTRLVLDTSSHGFVVGDYIQVTGTLTGITGITNLSSFRVGAVDGVNVDITVSTTGTFAGSGVITKYAPFQPEVWTLVVVAFTLTSPRMTIWSAVHGRSGLTIKHTVAGSSGQYPSEVFNIVNRFCVGGVVQANDEVGNPFRGEISHLALWDNTEPTDAYVLDLNTTVPTAVPMGTLISYYPFTENANDVVGSNHLTMFGTPTINSSGPSLAGGGAGGSVVISSISDASFNVGQSVIVSGETFGASQGTGKVYISPTNNVNDSNKVEQTISSWADTSIEFVAVKGALSFNSPYYLFVKNNSAASNSSGYSVAIEPVVSISEILVNLQGQAAVNETGLTVFVWKTAPSVSNTVPDQVLANQTTNGSGLLDLVLDNTDLNENDPVWIAIFKDGTPYRATMKKLTPVYE